MRSMRIEELDVWRPGYGQTTVHVLQAGTATLASLHADEGLNVPAAYPQALIERIDGAISDGRLQARRHVGVAYVLAIDPVDHTGITRTGV